MYLCIYVCMDGWNVCIYIYIHTSGKLWSNRIEKLGANLKSNCGLDQLLQADICRNTLLYILGIYALLQELLKSTFPFHVYPKLEETYVYQYASWIMVHYSAVVYFIFEYFSMSYIDKCWENIVHVFPNVKTPFCGEPLVSCKDLGKYEVHCRGTNERSMFFCAEKVDRDMTRSKHVTNGETQRTTWWAWRLEELGCTCKKRLRHRKWRSTESLKKCILACDCK